MRTALVVSIIGVLASRDLRAETPLVTGNGFGFAFYSDALTTLYAHPFAVTKPDPKDALGEGVLTASFVKKLAWDTTGPAHAGYLDESQIIVVDRAGGREAYFMPFGLERHVLVASWLGKPAPLCVEWAHPVKAQRTQRVAGQDVQIWSFDGVDETLIAVPLGPPVEATARDRCLTGRTSWAFASLEDAKDLAQAVGDIVRWQNAKSPQAVVDRELAEIEAWRVKPAVTFKSDNERKLWRQSEILLRVAQSREPNRKGRVNHGLIVACIPNGDWISAWVRDMTFSIDALIRMGHQPEARAAILALFEAQPVGKMEKQVHGQPYQVSVVRYFGDGSEEPFFTQEGSNNIEFDNWGLVLWVLGEYVSHFHDDKFLATPTYRGTVYDSAKRYIVKPLLANLEPYKDGKIVALDTSVWEERQKDQKHFAFSTTAAIAGLRLFDGLATAQKDAELHTELVRTLPLLGKGFTAAFTTGGSIHGTLEPGIKNDVDGAALSAITFGVVTDRAVIEKTVEQMAKLKEPSGGYRRVTCILEDPKIFEYYYERQEFLFIDFSLAEVYMRLGQPEKAAKLLAMIVERAAKDHFFIPEMYVSVVNPRFKGAIGDPTGAIPMIGYGAGAYISYLLKREAP